MGQSDNDALVMETVRRRTGNDAVGENTRFAEDLHMGEIARRLLFSFMMETFTARGVNLPAKGCFVSSFMPCATPGEVQAVIRGAFGKKAAPAQAEVKAAVAQAPTPVETAPSRDIERLAPGQTSQGVAAEIEPRPLMSLAQLLDESAAMDSVPFLLLLDQIQDPHNLGAILRTADAAGVHGIVFPQPIAQHTGLRRGHRERRFRDGRLGGRLAGLHQRR